MREYDTKRLGYHVEIRPMAWAKEAACRGCGTKIFFPEVEYFHSLTREERVQFREEQRVAKQFCLSCPVQGPCLEHALAVPERDGIWGGMNPRERLAHAKRIRADEIYRRLRSMF